ncbi:MAG: hypothetical protein GY946_23380, partial [bacterium]|nr:hypothetical protein [bacterium]
MTRRVPCRPAWCLLVSIIVALASAPASANGEDLVLEIGGHELVIGAPLFAGLKPQATSAAAGQMARYWGPRDGRGLLIDVVIYERAGRAMWEPTQLVDVYQTAYLDPGQGGNPAFKWSKREMKRGPYGTTGYGMFAGALLPTDEKPKTEVMLLAGLLPTHGFIVRVEVHNQVWSDAERASVQKKLADNVRAKCPLRNPKWTDEEAKAYWADMAPSAKVKGSLKRIIRTKHFIVFACHKNGASFGKRAEKTYKATKAAFPFEEHKEQRLMPLLILDTKYSFQAFYKKHRGETEEQQEGLPGADFYATYGKDQKDPGHVYGFAALLGSERLRLAFSSQWLVVGVPYYMATDKRQRKRKMKPLVTKGKHVPVREMLAA